MRVAGPAARLTLQCRGQPNLRNLEGRMAASVSMDDLPAPVVAEILSRLADSTDLARCRLASTTLRSLSHDVRAIALRCSRDRFLRSRDPGSRPLPLPFRALVPNLLSLLPRLDSLSLAVDDLFPSDDGDFEFDDSDDLNLTAVDFVSRWLPATGPQLRSLSISDLWAQSCWRSSTVLAIVSSCCLRLRSLELRNAWLSVEGLRPNPTLTSLTLEFIRLEDENLDGLCACFPFLETLNLIGVGGLNEPRIRLPHLKICRWTLSHVPVSVAIDAPRLTDLDLICVRPRALSLQTPFLRRLHLKMKRAASIEVGRFVHLRSVRMEASSGLGCLIRALAGCEAAKKAELEVPAGGDGALDPGHRPLSPVDIASAFPLLEELALGPGAWDDLANCAASSEPGPAPSPQWRCLQRLTVHLPRPPHFFVGQLPSALAACGHLREVVVLAREEDAGEAMETFVSECRRSLPGVKWRWGLWRECFGGALLQPSASS